DRAHTADSRAVDEDVDRPVERIDRPPHRPGIGHVTFDEAHAVGRAARQIERNHPRPGGGQRPRRRFAQTGIAAGDYGGLACRFHISFSPTRLPRDFNGRYFWASRTASQAWERILTTRNELYAVLDRFVAALAARDPAAA